MTKGLTTSILGRTGIRVTKLGYGAMEVSGRAGNRSISDQEAGIVLNTVLDEGINFIDTSNDYGRSEELIGAHISHRRSEFTLATKCGCAPDGGPHIWTRENLFRCLNESLKRLKVEYVDLLQLHNATVEDCKKYGVVETLKEMRQQGKTRWFGASAILPSLQTFIEWDAFDEFQIPYSALEREHEDWIDNAVKAGMGTVIRGGVAKGEPGQGLGRSDVWNTYEEARLDELRGDGETPTGFMFRYTLSHPGINTIIVGTQNTNHLRANIESLRMGPLPPDVYSETKNRLTAVGMTPATGPS